MSITASYQPNDYANLSKLVKDKKYAKEKFITVKKMDHLFILKYVKNKLTTENMDSLGLFRSIIVDEEGNILSFAPPKSINFDIFSQTNEYDKCYIQHFPEGTMINVFFDKQTDDWEISTRSSIGAKCNFNMDSNFTYRYMFLDAMNHTGLEFHHLDKTACYSFVLQHPKNRIVVPITQPGIILTNKYKIENNLIYNNNNITSTHFTTLSMHSITDESFFPKSFNYTGNSWKDMIDHFFSSNLPYQLQGIVLYNNKGQRTKIRNKNYEEVKHLRGNSPKLQYQYYNLRQQDAVRNFLKYYPEHKQEFSDFRRDLHKYTAQLYQNYINCFIKKQKSLKEFPYQFKTHMFKLQELYINELKLDGKFVNKKVVIDYINTLPPPRLMHSINYIKKQFDKDQKIITSDLKVIMKSEIQ
tara:strand:- start:1537 stop:2775 length:1239 start_codon:yes stop_codon:yes gene_type:complete